MEEKFKENVRYFILDLLRYKNEPHLIKNIINEFEDDNQEFLEIDLND